VWARTDGRSPPCGDPAQRGEDRRGADAWDPARKFTSGEAPAAEGLCLPVAGRRRGRRAASSGKDSGAGGLATGKLRRAWRMAESSSGECVEAK
jgi:hypothetical protein